jgi:hypothetical protein
MREAAVDMKQGDVVSHQPVEVMLPNGLLAANGMGIPESGMIICLNRRVVVMRDPAETTVDAK